MTTSKELKIAASLKNNLFYSDFAEYYGKYEFYKKLMAVLDKRLSEKLMDEEVDQILNLIVQKKIEFINPELFFYPHCYDSDPALKIYKKVTSFEFFMRDYLLEIKRMLNYGASYICMDAFLLVWSDILANSKAFQRTLPDLRTVMDSFLQSLVTFRQKNPFIFRIYSKKFFPTIREREGIDTSKYEYVFKIFVESFVKLKKVQSGEMKLPTIEIVHPVYSDYKNKQLVFLRDLLNLGITEVKEVLKDSSHDLKDPQFVTAIEFLKSRSMYNGIDLDSILRRLEKIEKECPFRTYHDAHSITDFFREFHVLRSTGDTLKVTYKFMDSELMGRSQFYSRSAMRINCASLKSLKSIESLIETAEILNNIRSQTIKKKNLQNEGHKIYLDNFKVLDESMLKALEKKRRQLSSRYKIPLSLEIFYDPSAVTLQTTLVEKPRYIRVVSDIHADLNRGKGYVFDFEDDFVVNCGDTSGDSRTTIDWVKSNVTHGVMVAGNYLGYVYPYPDRNGEENIKEFKSFVHPSNTKQGQILELSQVFDSNHLKFLSSTCFEYDDIVFLGCTLFTNFELLGVDKREYCMNYARTHSNDFVHPKSLVQLNYEKITTYENAGRFIPDKRIRTFTPEDHRGYSIRCIQFLKEKLEEYKTKPVVIVTHHAPLPFSLSPQYVNDPASALMVNDIRHIFKKYNIRLFCHGHVHHSVDYIYEGTRVVCCPFGLYNENNFSLPSGYGKRILLGHIKSGKPWSQLLRKEIQAGEVKVFKD